MRRYVCIAVGLVDETFESKVMNPLSGYNSNYDDSCRFYEVLDENDAYWLQHQMFTQNRMIQIVSSGMWINNQQ